MTPHEALCYVLVCEAIAKYGQARYNRMHPDILTFVAVTRDLDDFRTVFRSICDLVFQATTP